MISKADTLHDVLDAFPYGGHATELGELTAQLSVYESEAFSSAVTRLQCCYPKGLLPPRGRRRWHRLRRYSRRNNSRLVRAIDSSLDWGDEQFLRAAAGSKPQIMADAGLYELRFRLVWGGLTYDLKPQVWRSLRYFWNWRGAVQGDFEDALWGEIVEYATVRQAIQRGHMALAKANVGWGSNSATARSARNKFPKFGINLSRPGRGDLAISTRRPITRRKSTCRSSR